MKGVRLILGMLSLLLVFSCIASWASIEKMSTRGIGVVATDPKTGEQKEIKLYNKSYAVIIGIDQYQYLPIDKQLSYAVKDARGVETALQKHFKFDKITTLYNQDATKANIMKVLSGDLSQISEEDSVFIFWAGHGYTEKTAYGDLGYLLPFDGTFNRSELYKNISMTALKDDISKRIPAKHVFYVMDSCYSGLLVTTRGDKERATSRNLYYLQEITKEKVRQVLTAGSKDQVVLDGGPLGHSVFTGRVIEALENTDDYITATELSNLVKEKVYSDANARGHVQTPKYGELFGLGDYVFVPSIERKVEDAQEKLEKLQAEKIRLDKLEKAAIEARDEQMQLNAALEKRVLEAKLKAEELRQEKLSEEQRKREQQAVQWQANKDALSQEKIEADRRLNVLRKQVEKKRESLRGITLGSLSPEKTLADMQQIDTKIKEIREQYDVELKSGISQIGDRYSAPARRISNQKKDEFESRQAFESRIKKAWAKLNSEEDGEIAVFRSKVENECDTQTTPFLKQLHNMSTHEFTWTADNLILALGAYKSELETYTIIIRAKQRINGILVAANAEIPIPRHEAREFKLHFENNMLRPEIKGHFPNPEVFLTSQAYVIDDATAKKYDLFTARLVDFENSIIYDTVNKLLWTKNQNISVPGGSVDNVIIGGIGGWRLPKRSELARMKDVYLGTPFYRPQKIKYFRIYGLSCSLGNGRFRDRDGLKCVDDWYWKTKAGYWLVRGK